MLRVVGGTDYIVEKNNEIAFFNEEAELQAEAEKLQRELQEKLEKLKKIQIAKTRSPKYRLDGELKQTKNNQTTCRRVRPIAEKEDVEKVKEYLESKIQNAPSDNKRLTYMRDLMIFVYGTNIGLRVCDLLNMKWSDIIENKEPMTLRSEWAVKEKKTDKIRHIIFNDSIKNITLRFLNDYSEQVNLNGFIFSKNGDKPFSKEKVNKIIKEATGAVGLEGRFSTHSLRKTFARQIFNTLEENRDPNAPALTTVQALLNHSDQKNTLCYIGITDETLSDVVNNLNL